MKSQRKAGILLSYLSQFIQLLSGLLYTPVMLRLLGQSEYGLYTLVYSVTAYLSLLSLGFSSSYIRYYSRIRQKGDERELARFNGMFLSVFLVMSLLCLLCGAVMVIHIHSIFGDGLSDAEYATASVLMVFMIGNMALSFPNSVFSSITSAHERFLFQKTLAVLQNILNPFLTLPLLIMGYGSVGMVVVTTVLTVGHFTANVVYCLHHLHVSFSFTHPDFALLKEMWVFTSFIFINLIVDQLNWNVDKYLLGRFAGTSAVAVYGVAATLNTHYISLSTSISSVFVPEVHRIVASSNDNRLLTALFTRVGRIQFLLLSLVLSGFIFFGRPFLHYWVGDSYCDSYGIALALMGPVTVPLIQNTGIEIQRAKNLHTVRSVVYLLIAIANVGLSIPLIHWYGALGAALGTAFSLSVGNIFFMNWYYHKKIGLDIAAFWKSISQFVPALLPPAILALLLTQADLYAHAAVWLAACAVYLFCFSLSLWKFGLNQSEKKIVYAVLRRFRAKNRE